VCRCRRAPGLFEEEAMQRYESRRRSAAVLASTAAFIVLAVGPAHGTVQTKDQQKCTNGINKSFANVTKAIGKDLVQCIKDNAKGKLAPMLASACFIADRRGKIQQAKDKTGATFNQSCTGLDNNSVTRFPDFGVTAAATVNQAASDKEAAVMTVLWGADPDAALVTEAANKPRSQCQQALAKDVEKCQDTQLAEFNRCKKAALASGASSAGNLASCVLADPTQKIAKACNLSAGSKVDKIRKDLQKRCVDRGVAVSAAFPGCPSATDVESAHACLATGVACKACEALRDADGLGAVNCDLLDNGGEDASCGPPPVCGDGVAAGTEECDDGGTMSGDGCSSTCQLENTSALCAGVATVAGTSIDSVLVASGLEEPVYVTAPPLDSNRTFVIEQPGRIRLIKNGVLQATPFLSIEGTVSCCGERGLLGLAFPPNYESSGLFYVYYTRNDGDVTIARYSVTANPDLADDTSGHVLFTIEHSTNSNHNGGTVVFGPDGFLYAGIGDGGGGGDPFEAGQDDGQLLGKLLRIDVGTETPAIFAKGLRNPYRFSFDRLTGDLYIADVGQNLWEEVDVQSAPLTSGLNYGWDIFEGNHCFEPEPLFPDCSTPPPDTTFPVLEYCHGQSDLECDDHPRGCSITGGNVYRGCRMPDLHGNYFYSDFCGAFIRTFQGVSGGAAQNIVDRTSDVQFTGGDSIASVVAFGEDARGEIYIVDHGSGGFDGRVFKIVPGS
jgi:cysteine-rich repeat protein